MQKTWLFCMIAVGCFACKQLEQSRLQTKAAAVRSAGIAAVYIGHANCHSYLSAQGLSAADIAKVIDRNRSFGRYITHLASGDNGELVTTEFLQARGDDELQFSGDRFLRKGVGITISMVQIESSCRRLLLRVDSPGIVPTLELLAGTHRKQEASKDFRADFGNDFGALQCNGAFCSFAAIKNATRYFSYLRPSADNIVKVRVRWCPRQNCERAQVETLTVTGIANAL